MTWNQHRDRWVDGGMQPAGTHCEKFARTRLAKQNEFVRDETSSSWTSVPKQVVGIAPYTTDGATAAKSRGTVVLEGEGKTRTRGCQTSPQRLQQRMNFIIQDISNVGRSCSGEGQEGSSAVMGFDPLVPRSWFLHRVLPSWHQRTT